MSEPLTFSPFPLLTWDGGGWAGEVLLPGFPGEQRAELAIRVPWTPDLQQTEARSAPPPSGAQAAAFDYLQSRSEEVWGAIRTAVQQLDSDGELFDAKGAPRDLEFIRMGIFSQEWEGLAYVGYEFASLDTWVAEHGLGVIAHGSRIIFVGMMEQAGDEGLIVKDRRKQHRLKMKG